MVTTADEGLGRGLSAREIERCVEFLLNVYDELGEGDDPVEALAEMLDGDRATAKTLLDGFWALDGAEQARLLMPEVEDRSLRAWLGAVRLGKKKRCVCAAMIERTDPASMTAWDCEYHGLVRAGTMSAAHCGEQARSGVLVQVGVEEVAFFVTEDGGCQSVVVMDGGEIKLFPHRAHLAVRCVRGGPRDHPHAGAHDSPLKVKDDMADPSER